MAVLWLAGCGGSGATTSHGEEHAASPTLRGPAFGLTEDNANLLWNPGSGAPGGGVQFQAARERLTALHPRYIRLLVDWAALQPRAGRAPSLQRPVDGCARSVRPCGAYDGLAAQLAAIASQQRAARAEGNPAI